MSWEPWFQNFRKNLIFKFQWWWNSYIFDLLVRGSLIEVGFLRIQNSQEIVKMSLTTSNLLYDKSVRKSHDKNWKKVKYKSDVWIGRGFYIYWYSEVITRKNVIIHFTADQLPVFCALLSAPGKYCNGYLLYTTGNIIGKN